jgi:hypothetical protein
MAPRSPRLYGNQPRHSERSLRCEESLFTPCVLPHSNVRMTNFHFHFSIFDSSSAHFP